MSIRGLTLAVSAALIAALAITTATEARKIYNIFSGDIFSFDSRAPVVFPEFYQMMEIHEGRAYSADHHIGKTSFLTRADCEAARPDPKVYYCLRYESARVLRYKSPAEEI